MSLILDSRAYLSMVWTGGVGGLFRQTRSLIMDRQGVSAVEFALIVPVLLLMLGAFFTVAIFIRTHTTISTYAREAARGVAVGYMTAAEAKQFAESHSLDDPGVVATANIDPATKGDEADRDVVVTIEITKAEMAKITPFGGFSAGVTSRAVMRSLAE